MRRFQPPHAPAWAAIVTAACFGLSGCGASETPAAKPPDYAANLRGSPPKLAAIHHQAGRLLPGGADAFKRRLAALRGYPVIVNKWASWCGPCRHEAPFFQSQSARHGRRIAFLGVNSNDGRASAGRFLREFPVPYPSYEDPNLEVAAVFKSPIEFPATAFYSRGGKLVYVKKGGYANESDLALDIPRYAR